MDMKEKLVELLNNSFAEQYEKRGLLTAQHTATDLIAHGVTAEDNTEITDELLEQFRNAPLTILYEEPTIEVVPEWISVKDRLPEDGEIVLVCGSRGGVYTAVLNKPGQYKGWHKLNSKSHYCDPTHWMPLPQPPKGE